ncbi:DUF4190 domain-containing protein [Rugosimonospora africana]|uniref:DUF4190 domain-containing protein n=1 Tax=Rugosimonospora africana TaxID=556532 RepID=A0A8J3VWF5_9ACTN|nr:DUF4190 domain-containing protein [Rugosimonospora africana]GIH20713.1 hypothetical protein Raf01_88850 [Rugosimonospora africana]
MSIDQQGPPPPVGSFPPVAPPPAAQGTNGLSIAGLILAIFVAPLGFILSIIGLVLAGRRGQKGKGLAIAGIIISVLIMGGSTAAIVALGGKVSTLTDPGCLSGKSAMIDNESKVNSPDTIKEGLQATIDGLNSAAGKAKHDNVRSAVQAVAADYSELLKDVNSGTSPSQELSDKLDTDASKLDSLCTVNTK